MDSQTGGRLDRRAFIKLAAGGVTLGAFGTAAFRELSRSGPARRPVRLTVASYGHERRWHFVATDGYAAMPDPEIVAPVGVYYPDLLAPDGQNLYVFGFNDVTDIAGFAGSNPVGSPWDPGSLEGAIDFKGLAQISAPLLYCEDGDEIYIRLENLGLAVRPDLFDPHTIHWHGFANQIPYFDGVPDASLSVPSGSELTYHYKPVDVGTYMYHCHVEDVEHVHMGLTGMVFIKPNSGSPKWSAASLDSNKKYAYYHPSTEYDREFAILLTESNVENHWNDGHIQESDWSEYRSTFGLMNGRSWPDTIAPNGAFFDRDPRLASGARDPAYPNGRWWHSQLSGQDVTRLAYQPNSSLIQANAGEKVLLRISNLGFDEHSLVLPGLEMTVVGRDAKFLGEGRDDYFTDALTGDGVMTRADITTKTYRLDLGPGESRDVIFTVPGTAATPPNPLLAPGPALLPGAAGPYTAYPLYDRSILFLKRQSAAGAGEPDGYGSMRTEVHVYAGGTLPKQAHPNQLFA